MQKLVPWWASGILYQVYPRSFQDSNGDGIGDLRGIIRRLPYLRELGVDAVWLSPIFRSPMLDFGYDISDYVGIDPLFGTLADFDALVAAVHGHELKLILDLVPNHTSDQHPWFLESRSSRDNPKRDWYIWRDGAGDGGPPTNWLSEFGGSAWQFDEPTRQYYYHAFLRQQPDLNWRNPQVRQAIADVVRFWLRRGVDGFRVDVMWHLVKDDQFRDNPLNPEFSSEHQPYQRLLPVYSTDRPEVHAVVAELRRVMDEFADRVLIGEIYLPPERLVAYYGENLVGAHLPFNFALISAPWTAAAIATVIASYEAALPPGAWPNWVLGNHDRMRIASRVGADQARLAAMLLLTLRGTPTMYYGDEIGLPQVPIPPEQVKDPFEKNVPGFGMGRDGCRTPMQWDGSIHAGFSTEGTWLPLSDNFRNQNVAGQSTDEASILNLYRALIALRRARPELSTGDYTPIAVVGDALVFQRTHGSGRLVVALNFGADAVSLAIETVGLSGRIVLSTVPGRPPDIIAGRLELRGGEGIILEPAA